MSSKYVDNSALVQVIGGVFNRPSYLDEGDKYVFNEDDFYDNFHKIVFGVIYNLYNGGARHITINTVEDYLENHPKQKSIYDAGKGSEYLLKASEDSNKDTFDYYYQRMKKMSLFRAYNNVGLNLDDLYDPDNILDLKRRETQEQWVDNNSLSMIADVIDAKIEEVRRNYAETNEASQSFSAGDGIEELIKQFEETPDIGLPLYGNYINTVVRGARLGKFYLRSAPTGTGKTRSMIADACNIACDKIYDERFGWIKNGTKNPTLFIATEQDLSEVQTMMLAFLSNVNEEHILNGKYKDDERDRVIEAAKIIKESPIYIEIIPDFSLQDIENLIKKHIRENKVSYALFDYIHTSLKILSEISRQTGKITLREDNVLFMLSTKLKDICVKYDIFILSSTQVNGGYTSTDTPDQNLLRGAKAIADKIDAGILLLPVTTEDLASLENILNSNSNFDVPNIKISIYKNRRGQYKSVFLWAKADLGVCRIQPMFMTDFRYELQSIEDIKIMVKEESAF